MRFFAFAIAAIVAATPAASEEPQPLTIKQCMEALAGLNSLNFVGQTQASQAAPPDAKPYKFHGNVRVTIAMDISALSTVPDAAGRAQQQFKDSVTAPAGAQSGKMVTPEQQKALADYGKQINDNWQSILDAPCNVKPGHLKATDVNAGDDDGQNPIPPSVYSLLVPIIDQ